MPKLTKEQYSKLRLHNKNIMAKATGQLSQNEVRSHYENSIGDFVSSVVNARSGKLMDTFGRPIAANDVSLDKALQLYYGVDLTSWLKQLQIYGGSDTLYTMARRFGVNNLSAGSVESLLFEHGQFEGLNTTDDVDKSFRWLIPEVILAAIRTDYEATSMHQNWIASTQNVTQRTGIKMPLIKRGNATPRKIGEAESIPFGSISFGEKSVDVFKVGTGFKITDELVEASSLNLLFNFLGEVGTDMSLATDVEALNVLVNGEQADSTESAPVVGVDVVDEYSYKDLKRVVARMERLRRSVTRIITGEDDGLDIALLDEFKGFPGDTKLGNLQGIMGKLLSLANDIYVMPADQVMMIAPQKCMTKLQYRGMKTERRRNPQTQEDEIFVSDYVGFAILRRDGRVIIDNTILYDAVAGEVGGFPLYMDIDARLNTAFKNLQNQ